MGERNVDQDEGMQEVEDREGIERWQQVEMGPLEG